MSKQIILQVVQRHYDSILKHGDAYMDNGVSRLAILNRYAYLLGNYGYPTAAAYFQEVLASRLGDDACCVMDDIFDELGIKTIDELDALAV